MIRHLLTLIALCAIASPVFAQQDEHISAGIGLSFSPLPVAGDDQAKFGPAGLADFLIPIQLGPYIRFEPQIGVLLQSSQEQISDTTVASGRYLRQYNHQIVRAGFGAFYTVRTDKEFQFGIGARIGIMSSEFETHSDKISIQDTDTHYAIFYLGAALSAEYFVSTHFSLGGELQFMHYAYGSPLQVVGSNDVAAYLNNTSEQSVFATTAVLSAKFWF